MTTHTARTAYTAGLRALADLLDQHPDIKLPHVEVCALNSNTINAYAAAFTQSGVMFTDTTDDQSRAVIGNVNGLPLRVTYVNRDVMARYDVEVEFVREQAPQIEARYQASLRVTA